MDAGPAILNNSFSPVEDSQSFRGALGAYTTGVTVITTITEEGPMGITANSFASVSLDPPLVLWSPSRHSRRFEHFARAPRFAIHVLAADQKHVCDAFTRSKTAFDGLDWTPNNAGVPLLSGVLAIFECNFEAAHHAGDHDIVVGRVIRAHHAPGVPLVFHGGSYGHFGRGA
ncbi:MAG: flavin reductase [Limimaricola sp.]|uniref:flavin reductase family protein n=1 Tax=Limimaricola sp. TaxID=2211665 RepID=UPI001D4A5E5C|nr:flavin reductase family protein [Limimaricola sp.]MBI1418611.1 flavin reductase [Limimaricola sp.]